MKIYKLPTLADASPNGEYCLGPEEAQTSSAYVVYGRLRPGQTGHRLALHDGHEEIICVVKGTMRVRCGKKSFEVSAGEAFNPGTGADVSMDNTGQCEAIFISARAVACAPAGRAAAPQRPAAPQAPEPPRPPRPEQAAHAEPAQSEFEITNDGAENEE